MNIKNAYAIRSEGLTELSMALQTADSPRAFLDEADQITNNSKNLLKLQFETGDPDPLHYSARATGQESINAQLVYEFLGSISRAQASDPRLWTYLAFRSYRQYMEDRWPLMSSDGSNLNWKNRAKSRWLMISGRRSLLVRHGIARLWWAAYLTHDPQARRPLSQAENSPSAYTDVAFFREDTFLQIFDRDIASNPDLLFGVLEKVAGYEDEKPEDFVRLLARGVVREYGYREVGALSPRALVDLLEECADYASRSVHSKAS